MNLYNSYLPLLLAQASMAKAPQPTMSLNSLLMAQLTSLALSSNSLNGKRNFVSQPDDESNFTASQKKLRLSGNTSVAHMATQSMPIQKTNVKFNPPARKPQQNIVVLDEEEDCLIIESPMTNKIDLPLISESQLTGSELSKQSAIIVIDDDEEDQLTCQSTPQTKNDDITSGLENLEFQRQSSNISEKMTTEAMEKTEEKSANSNVIQHAKIPAFELSVVNQKQRKSRKVKLVWEPECCDDATLENWAEQIGNTVGIQISGQEKIGKTMKNFDMNLDLALERIKRNKAHYKDYFRTRKLYKK